MGGGTYLEDFTEHELVVMGEMIDKARRDRYFGYKRKGMPKHKFIEFLQVGLGGDRRPVVAFGFVECRRTPRSREAALIID